MVGISIKLGMLICKTTPNSQIYAVNDFAKHKTNYNMNSNIIIENTYHSQTINKYSITSNRFNSNYKHSTLIETQTRQEPVVNSNYDLQNTAKKPVHSNKFSNSIDKYKTEEINEIDIGSFDQNSGSIGKNGIEIIRYLFSEMMLMKSEYSKNMELMDIMIKKQKETIQNLTKEIINIT